MKGLITMRKRVVSLVVLLVLMLIFALESSVFAIEFSSGSDENSEIKQSAAYFREDFGNGLGDWSVNYQMAVNAAGQLATTVSNGVCKVVSPLDFAVKDMILEYDMQISSNAADNFMFVTDLRCEDKVDAVRIILYKNAITVISSTASGTARQVYSKSVVDFDEMYRVRVKLIGNSLSYEIKNVAQDEFEKIFKVDGMTLDQKGQFSFLVSNTDALIDNIFVTNLDVVTEQNTYYSEDFKNGLDDWSVKYQMEVNVEGQLATTVNDGVCKVVSPSDFAVENMILEYDMQITANAANNFMFVTDLRCEDKVDAVRIILYKDAMTVIASTMSGPARQVCNESVINFDTVYRVRIKLVDDTLIYEIKSVDDEEFVTIFEMSGIMLSQKGQFSFLVSNAEALIDNVSLVNLDDDEIQFEKAYYYINTGTTASLDFWNRGDHNVVFSSSNHSVATVDNEGNVTTIAKGEAYITVATINGDESSMCKVISTKPVTNVVLHKNTMQLEVGESEELLGYMVPNDATNTLIYWEVEDPEIISLTGIRSSARGVTALKPGQTKIKVTSDEGGYVSICNVTVTEKTIPDSKNATLYFDGYKREIPEYIYGNIETTTLYQASAGMLNQNRNIETEKANELYKMQLNKETGFQFLRSYVHWYDWQTGYPTNVSDEQRGNLIAYPLQYYFENADAVNMPICIGINVNQDVETAFEGIKKIKELSDGRPFWIEYGNELYAISAEEIVANVDEYVRKLRALNNLVKAYDPNIKIGVPLLALSADRAIKNDPNNWVRSEDDWEYTQGARALEWNKALAQNPDCYDAIVVHYYSGIHNFTDIKPKDVLRIHLKDVLLQGFSTEAMLKRQYPGKELWVTEYGVLSYNVQVGADEAERGRRQYCKSLGNAITYLVTFLEQLKNGATLTSAASIIGGNGFECYQVVGNNALFSENELVKLPNGYLYEKFSPIINSSTQYYDLMQKEGTVYTSQIDLNGERIDVLSPDILAYGFGDDNKANYILLINQYENPTTVTIEGTDVTPLWVYEGTYGAYPYWTNNPNSRMSDVPQHIDVPVDLEGIPQENIELPPFSITCVGVSKGINDGISAQLREKLSDTIVLKSSASQALGINGEIFYVDSFDSTVQTVMVDGQLFVPARALLTNDNILVSYDSVEQQMSAIRIAEDGNSYSSVFDIRENEIMIDRLEIFPEGGGGVIYEGGRTISLETQLPGSVEELYLPLEIIAQITGRCVINCGEGVYLLSKSNIVLNSEEIQILSMALRNPTGEEAGEG